MSGEYTTTNPMSIDQLMKAMEIIRMLNPKQLQFHHAQIFIYVANKGMCTYRELEEKFGLSNAAVSRSVCSLSEVAKHKVSNPLGLLDVFPDPDEGRRHMIKLTSRGEALKDLIEAV